LLEGIPFFSGRHYAQVPSPASLGQASPPTTAFVFLRLG
jgi:hypothetical protein